MQFIGPCNIYKRIFVVQSYASNIHFYKEYSHQILSYNDVMADIVHTDVSPWSLVHYISIHHLDTSSQPFQPSYYILLFSRR